MLERDVVVGAAARVRRLFGEGRRRGGGAPRGRALGAAHEFPALRDDFGRRTLLGGLSPPAPRLRPPHGEALTALLRALAGPAGLVAASSSADEASFLP